MYMGEEIIVSEWHAKRYSNLYYSKWEDRNKFAVPLRVGFFRAVNGAFDKINNYSDSNSGSGSDSRPGIINVPTLVLTSEADDVLSYKEIIDLSLKINPNRQIIQYKYNTHDVFMSGDFDDSLLAIADVKMFLQEQGFYD